MMELDLLTNAEFFLPDPKGNGFDILSSTLNMS